MPLPECLSEGDCLGRACLFCSANATHQRASERWEWTTGPEGPVLECLFEPSFTCCRHFRLLGGVCPVVS